LNEKLFVVQVSVEIVVRNRCCLGLSLTVCEGSKMTLGTIFVQFDAPNKNAS